jgi:hypothetical protein
MSEPLKLIAVSRIRNEEDIVEAFVRHHAGLVDRHIFVDNGSNDQTVPILRALKNEGIPLTLFRDESVAFLEAEQNTFLFRQAAALGAHWVLYLDCDEFFDPSRVGGSLHRFLAAIPTAVDSLQIEMANYHPTGADDAADLVVPRRIRHRHLPATGVTKILVRGRLAALGATVERGNHAVTVGGTTIPAVQAAELRLAHFPMRSGWQMLAKAFVGRLKVLAAGAAESERGSSSHYTEMLGNLRTHPEWLLSDGEFLAGSRPPEFVAGGVAIDPIAYLGGELRYTSPIDARHHAANSVVGYAEHLARSYARFLDQHDQNPGERWLAHVTQVF